MSGFEDLYNAGLERAAEHLLAKAAMIRGEPPEILALRRTQ